MRKNIIIIGLIMVVAIMAFYFIYQEQIIFSDNSFSEEQQIKNNESNVSLDSINPGESELKELIYNRTSIRDYADKEVSLKKAGNILWSAEGLVVDGVSGPTRTSPSAGATNPLVVYISVRDIAGLEPGIYRYHTVEHDLFEVVSGDVSQELARAALGQRAIAEAPFSVIITANYGNTTSRYGERGKRYVHIEAGHAAQNVLLMAENQELSGVIIGAFNDEDIQETMGGIPEIPLIIIPLGYVS